MWNEGPARASLSRPAPDSPASCQSHPQNDVSKRKTDLLQVNAAPRYDGGLSVEEWEQKTCLFSQHQSR